MAFPARGMLVAGIILSLTLTGSSSVPLEEDCDHLTEKHSSLEIEHNNLLRKLSTLRDQASRLRERDSADTSDLSEITQTHSVASERLRTASAEAAAAKSALLHAQVKVNQLVITVNNTQSSLRVSQDELRSTISRIEKLETERAADDALSRKLDLKSQLLVNDLESANKTSTEIARTSGERQLRIKEAERHLAELQKKVADLKSKTEIALGELSELNHSISDDRKEQVAVQQGMFYANKEKDIVDQKMVQTKLNHLETEAASVQADEDSTISDMKSLNATMKEISVHEPLHVSIDSTVSQEELRSTIRDSRRFLLQHGYDKSLSLVQTDNSTGSGDLMATEAHILQDKSHVLALEEEIHDMKRQVKDIEGHVVDFEGTMSQKAQELKISSDILSQMQKDLVAKNATLTQSAKVISELGIKAVKVRDAIASRTIQLEQKEAELQGLQSRLKAAISQMGAMNSTLAHLLAVQDDAQDSLHKKLSEIEGMTRDKAVIVGNLTSIAHSLLGLDKLLAETHNRSNSLEDSSKQLSSSLDDQKRQLSEALADVAQITRRLEEKSIALDKAVNDEKQSKVALEEMESAIRNSMKNRFDNDNEISSLEKADESISESISTVQRQLNILRCTALSV